MVLRSGFNSRGSNQRRRKETHHGTQPCGCGRHDRRKRGRTPEKTHDVIGADFHGVHRRSGQRHRHRIAGAAGRRRPHAHRHVGADRLHRHRGAHATQTQQQTHLGMGATRSAHRRGRRARAPDRRHLRARRSRHEAVRRSRRRSARRAVAAVHGHTRPCRQRRFDLHPRGAKRGQHEHESRVPRSHERRIGVRGRDRFSHRADLNGLGRLRCRRGRHHRLQPSAGGQAHRRHAGGAAADD